MASAGQQPPAGWYPDPSDPGTQRYWDGSAWTDHSAPLAQAQGDPAGYTGPTPGHTSLLVAGWLTAIFFPPVGIAIAINMLQRDQGGQGKPMLIVSLVVLALYILVFVAGALTEPSSAFSS